MSYFTPLSKKDINLKQFNAELFKPISEPDPVNSDIKCRIPIGYHKSELPLVFMILGDKNSNITTGLYQMYRGHIYDSQCRLVYGWRYKVETQIVLEKCKDSLWRDNFIVTSIKTCLPKKIYRV